MKRDDMLYVLAKNIKPTTPIDVFDLARSTSQADSLHVVYEVMEALSDRLISSGKYDSVQRPVPRMHIDVFANYPPEQEYMSQDRLPTAR